MQTAAAIHSGVGSGVGTDQVSEPLDKNIAVGAAVPGQSAAGVNGGGAADSSAVSERGPALDRHPPPSQSTQ